MRNLFILGSGRSGTSMVAGSLARCGYAMGEGLWRPRAANPKGFFEAPRVNDVNERLLEPVVPREQGLGPGQRWLARLPRDLAVPARPELEPAMRELLAQEPYCYKDPRFSYTLPAWRPLLEAGLDVGFGATGLVCVFRHPALTAASIAEEVRTAAYLEGVSLDERDALEVWTAMYRRILAERGRGDWLFLHYDQMLADEGPARLARFARAGVDAGFADRALRREPPAADLPPGAAEVYGELCELAGHDPAARTAVPVPELPRVAAIVPVRDADRAGLTGVLADLRAQRGVALEVVVVDQTRAGDLAEREARGADRVAVVRETVPSRGLAWRRGLERTEAPLVAWIDPAARTLPHRLARQAAVLAGNAEIDLVTSDLHLTAGGDDYVDRARVDLAAGAPEPCWWGGVLLRRTALEEIETTCFAPVELALAARLAAAGRTAHVDEALGSVDRGRFEALKPAARQDAQLVRLARTPFTGERPEATVLLATHERCDVLLECLEAFSRQLLPPGTFEIVVVDDGSTDATPELAARLELPVPYRFLHKQADGASRARILGMPHARGRLVVFVNDDTIPFPDLVQRHLVAHRELEARGEKAIVLGTFEQSDANRENAFIRFLERTHFVFGYADFDPAEPLDGSCFYTCNVSVPADAVREAGGFDPEFSHYGCEDTDLGVRLEDLGYRIRYRPEVRAWHRHFLDFDTIRRRQRVVAKAHTRLFQKFPRLLNSGWAALDEATLRPRVERVEPFLSELEAAARTLAGVNLAKLERLGEELDPLARDVEACLFELFPKLNGVWWDQGFLDGFRVHGLSGFPELVAAAREEDCHA